MEAAIGFALEVTFLTGRIGARRVEDETKVEWPPHPARIFAALAAAYFEGGEEAEERRALEWLEFQDPPAIWVSGEPTPERWVEAYVPINPDTTGLAVIPIHRTGEEGRKRRSFTSAFVSDASVVYGWPDTPEDPLREALARLCARVAAIGHSSSLVRLVPVSPPSGLPSWIPDKQGRVVLRVPFPGMLDSLRFVHERYIRMGIRGAIPAVPQPYVETLPEPAVQQAAARQGAFESIWFLRKLEGPELPAVAAPGVASALRRTVMALWGAVSGDPSGVPVPEEVSGHRPAGEPLERPHIGWVAIPAVGHPHSSGHLLGVGVVLPRGLPEEVRTTLWRVLSDLKVLHLRPGSWRLEFVGRGLDGGLPVNLRGSRWSSPARIWASVTPVVLDRYPHDLWGPEAEAAVRLACRRAFFPEPEEVVIRPTAFVPGAPPARYFPGYPPGYPTPRVHAVLVFAEPVAGPMLLGRGRYRGLGLFLPIQE